MPRVKELEIDDVAEDVRDVYRRFGTEYGPFLNQVKAPTIPGRSLGGAEWSRIRAGRGRGRWLRDSLGRRAGGR